ncbi:MAG: stage 0 sporulation protein [Candidatus Aureabacteria bacterium]|nr:stage 0 sporulation protein [Candidatus Auribacterota bacterium]
MDIVIVKHRGDNKVSFYNPCGKQFCVGDTVIIEVEKGSDHGLVLKSNFEIDPDEINPPILCVRRLANSYDLKKIDENKVMEEKSFQFCKKCIKKRGLPMKLIAVEYLFDRKRIKFFFTAEKKVDFRELVKDLVEEFKIGVELRQIGVRDACKIRGGIGICGRTVCCATHLNEFMVVNLKMARLQDMSSSPDKISGICGRLCCCLRYEYENYQRERKDVPDQPGDEKETAEESNHMMVH